MRRKLCSWFIMLTLLAGIHTALAQPVMGIVLTNKQSLLYWPSNASGFVLQSTTNLASPNWAPATDATPATYGSQTAATVTNLSAVRFFRLFQNIIVTTSDGMALIPAGSFTIGNSVGDTDSGLNDAIPTNVYVSAFYMDTNLVSYGQWQSVYAYATSHGYGFDTAGSGKAANHPVQTVYWYDVVKWCNARSQQAGLSPVYYTDAGMTQIYTNGDTDAVYPNWAANGYRLPTEAEWEKAARGGLSGQRYPWGATISESQANYSGNTSFAYDLGPDGYNTNFDTTGYPLTSPVAYFAPNGYGLYDMAGNVFEWCWDWYAKPPNPAGSPYAGGTDPRGPASSPDDNRVVRGDDCYDASSFARCAFRFRWFPAGYSSFLIGFRCVRNVPSSTTAGGMSMALIPAGT